MLGTRCFMAGLGVRPSSRTFSSARTLATAAAWFFP